MRAPLQTTGRWIAVLVASLLVHIVVLSALRITHSEVAAPRVNAIDVTFAVLAPETPPSDAARASKEEARVTPPQRRPAAVSPDRFAPPEPSTTSRASLVVPAPELDPATVARSFVLSQQTLQTEASGAGEGTSVAEAEAPDYFKGLGINEKRYLSRREPPKVLRHRDGTHRYRGHAFKAIIEQDGSVTFDDGYPQGSTVRFDITDLMMRRRGEDPYRVEKNWFLEGTTALRQELHDRWKAKHLLIALRKLRVRLLHISENQKLSDRQKSNRVIAIFEDTSDDDAGAAARKTIAEFVADEMPEIVLPVETP